MRCGVALSDIVAMLGPFSTEFNKAMFKEYQTDYVVMKNAGAEGGTPQKLEACTQLNITPIVIGRGKDSGYSDLDRLIADLPKNLIETP